ncbi:hypothetical protein GYA19_05875 [Candidatus Beckwithbacteria bacterium]|nr:hypothetical protein [Candidatus Beckwithbacteria bacterium]
MTLNQLAFSMWEKLGYKEIDASVLSRVISGERLFTQRQLNVFCSILKIKKQKALYLKEALLLDIYKKYNLEINHYFLVDLPTEKILKKIAEYRWSGDYGISNELTDILLDRFRSLKTKMLFSPYSRKFFDTYGKILLEKCYNNMLLSPNKVVYHEKIVTYELREIGEILKKKNFIGLSYFVEGEAYYIAEKYDRSFPIIYNALDLIKDQNTRIEAVRVAILNTAYLNLEKKYKEITALAAKIFNYHKILLSPTLSFIEGLGRAQGILKMQEALNTIEEAEEIYKKSKSEEVFRLIQFDRSRLEILKRTKQKDKNYFEKVGKRGLNLAENYGYYRYITKIREMMNKTI